MKRKGFTFYESYYQVVNELDNDKDKLDFIMALLARQFEGIEPTNLTKMASFAYKSQQHSIDKQVEGYESKTGNKLTPYQDPTEGSCEGSKEGGTEGSYEPPTEGSYEGIAGGVVMTTEGSSEGPYLQEKEKEKEKEEEKVKEKEKFDFNLLVENSHLIDEYIK